MISVIVTSCDRPNLLDEALDSVLFQTYRDFEILVMDGGSEDLETVFGVVYFKQELTGIPISLRTTQPLPIGRVRNMGVSFSSGDLIAFLDDDDLWQPNKLAMQVEMMNATDADACHTYVTLDCRGWTYVQKLSLSVPVGNMIMTPSSLLIKRDVFHAVGGFDEDLPVCEDRDLMMRLAMEGYKQVVVEEPLTTKRLGIAPNHLTDRYNVPEHIQKVINRYV